MGVHDQMQVEMPLHRLVDLLQESDELLCAVARLAFADLLAPVDGLRLAAAPHDLVSALAIGLASTIRER